MSPCLDVYRSQTRQAPIRKCLRSTQSDSQHVKTHVLHRGVPTLHMRELGLKVVIVALFNETAENKTEKLLVFFLTVLFPQRKEGLKRGEGVFLDGVNSCRVTV